VRELLTPSTTLAQLERLNAVFAKHTADELRRLAGGYHEALKDLDEEQVAGAISVALREEPRFPVPAKIREHARAWRERNRPQLLAVARPEDERSDVVCKTCGSTARMAWLEGTTWGKDRTSLHVKRYIAPCNPQRHPPGTGYVPYPPTFLGWVDE